MTSDITYDIVTHRRREMSKKEKRESRIRNNPQNSSLGDFEALINQYGEINEGTKHPQAVIGNRVFIYKRSNPVLYPYVEKILEIIDDLKQKQTKE